MKPFLSVFIVFSILFGVVFVKMENRRAGYLLLKLSREKRILDSEYHLQKMNFARLMRPDRVEKYASTYLELKRAGKTQVIQITSPRVVVRD